MPETLTRPINPEHFELRHQANGETTICMQHGGECSLSVDIADGYEPSELQQLITATESALTLVDKLLEGRTSQVFAGLRIQIGEGLAAGGADALPAENRIRLNGRMMLLSLAAMREQVDAYEDHELRGGTVPEHTPGGALVYTLIHEMGHILNQRTASGQPRQWVATAESPTRYGREPDAWHAEEEHKRLEAICDGFAHMATGMPVTVVMTEAVNRMIDHRLAEL